ncbi:MAG: hypothetical protein ACTHNT_15205, partial [Actinomycetales bacterium]
MRWSRSKPSRPLRHLVPAAAATQPAAGDRVRVGLASFPARASGLRTVVESMIDQADEVCVYLNGYRDVPAWLTQLTELTHRVRAVLGPDLGDRGKFAFLDGFRGYYLSVDDDIAYPPDYVAASLSAVERWSRQAVVGWHGSVLSPDIADYYDHSRRRVLHHARHCPSDEYVHVLGTGALAFHTDTLSISLDDFEQPNLADLYFARLAHRQGVPAVSLAHPAGWAPAIPFPREETIWGASVDRTSSSFDTRSVAAGLLPELAARLPIAADVQLLRQQLRTVAVELPPHPPDAAQSASSHTTGTAP